MDPLAVTSEERPKRQIRMTPEQLDAFLGESRPEEHATRLGIVASLMADGSPHLTPLWYRWTGEVVRIWTGEELLWARNVAREPRVAFSVMDDREPCPAVVIRGRAEIRTADSADDPELRAEVRAIAERYLPAQDAAAFAERWTERRTLITIHPDRVVSWAGAG